MDHLKYDLLSLMFLLGFVQILWALIHIAYTDNDTIRKHFAIYFAGVGIYFFMLIMLIQLAENYNGIEFLVTMHFFGSAFGLALYHFGIVCASVCLAIKPIFPVQKPDF